VIGVPGITASVQPFSVASGTTRSFSIFLSPQFGYRDAVTVTSDALPSGMSMPNIPFTTAAFPLGDAQLIARDVTVSAGFAAGVYPITFHITGTGGVTATATTNITVTN
jgi:hypothetical protein